MIVWPACKPSQRKMIGARKIATIRARIATMSCVAPSLCRTDVAILRAKFSICVGRKIATMAPMPAKKMLRVGPQNTSVNRLAKMKRMQKNISKRWFFAYPSISLTDTPSFFFSSSMVSPYTLLISSI